MNRKIIFYENYFVEFYQEQDQKVKEKIQYVFDDAIRKSLDIQ